MGKQIQYYAQIPNYLVIDKIENETNVYYEMIKTSGIKELNNKIILFYGK